MFSFGVILFSNVDLSIPLRCALTTYAENYTPPYDYQPLVSIRGLKSHILILIYVLKMLLYIQCKQSSLGRKDRLLRFMMFYIYLEVQLFGVNRVFYGYDLFQDFYRFQGENIAMSKIYQLLCSSSCFIIPIPEFNLSEIRTYLSIYLYCVDT